MTFSEKELKQITLESGFEKRNIKTVHYGSKKILSVGLKILDRAWQKIKDSSLNHINISKSDIKLWKLEKFPCCSCKLYLWHVPHLLHLCLFSLILWYMCILLVWTIYFNIRIFSRSICRFTSINVTKCYAGEPCKYW